MTKGWSRPFEDPIVLPDGRKLIALKNAADVIMKLRRAEAREAASRVEVLIMAAEGRGPLMHARIGVMQDLNRKRRSRLHRPQGQSLG
jgi:hypothetical protein